MTAPTLDRAASRMALITVVSRATGFIRVVVVTAVLGTSFLANTYQSANSIPNLLFELVAAGALQAGLIPVLVRLVDRGDDRRTGEVAGSLIGLGCLATGIAVALAAVFGRPLMAWLVHGVSDPAIRAAEIRLGAFFLWVFAPQVVLYVANAVCTAVLHTRGRFGLPAAAPILNNGIVIATYVVFNQLRHGQAPSLELRPVEKWVLAGGTTLGVVAFCGAVVAGAVAVQPHIRPNLRWRDQEVISVLRSSAWVIGYVALTQVLTFVMLQAVNRQEGGVAAFGLAWVVFLLPHSLLVVPLVTTRFPALARASLVSDADDDTLSAGLRGVTFCTLGAGALLGGLALPLSRIIAVGRASTSSAEVAGGLAALAVGLAGYGVTLLLTRASYASGDPVTPFIINLVCVMGAAAALWGWAADVPTADVVAVVALIHSLTFIVSACWMGYTVLGRLDPAGTIRRRWLPRAAAQVGTALLVVAAARLLGDAVGDRGRLTDAVVVIGAGGAFAAAYVVGTGLFGGPSVRDALATFGAGRPEA